jgi:hypothetical protein
MSDEKREKALNDVKLYLANDWKLKEETPEYFLLERNEATTAAHVIIFCLTFYTFGIVNILFHFLKRKTKKIVK